MGPSTIDLALVIQGFLHRSFYNLKINIFNNLISIIVGWVNLLEDYGWSIADFWEIKNEDQFCLFCSYLLRIEPNFSTVLHLPPRVFNSNFS